MKLMLAIILTLAISMQLFAQEQNAYNPFLQRNNNPMFVGTGINPPTSSTIISGDKKMDVSVQLGTSFATNFRKAYAFTTFARPELKYRLGKKFTLRGGISLANSEYRNTLMYSPYGFSSFSGNITQGMLYVSGDYVISPKVVLSGTAYKEFPIGHGAPDEVPGPAYDGKGLMMNLRISPHENMFIDVGAEFYQGNNPYMGSYYHPYRSNPFMWD